MDHALGGSVSNRQPSYEELLERVAHLEQQQALGHERIQAEAQREGARLTALLERLNEAQQVARIGSWEWDLRTNRVWWSDETYRIFGVTREGFIPSFEANGAFVHPDDLAKYGQAFEHSLQTGDLLDFDFRLVAADGQVKHCSAKGQVLYDDVHQPLRFVGTVMDVTARRQAELALRGSEQRMATFVANMNSAALLVGADSRVVFANQAFCEYFGLQESPADLMGIRSEAMIEKIRNAYLDPNAQVARITEILRRGERVVGEEVAMRGDRFCLRDFIPISVDRRSRGRAWHHTDITERKRAEEALRESRAKLAATFASMTEAVFVADAEGRLTDFNDEFVRYHRFKDRAECSRTIADCPMYLDAYLSDGSPAPPELWAMPRALRGETASNVEYRLRRKDTGETWWGSYSFGPIRDRDGGLVGAVVAAREITANKRAEEALRESEELRRAVTDNSPDAIYVKDLESRWLMANPAVLRIVGKTAEQALGKTDLELYADPLIGRAILDNDRRVLERGESEAFEELADTADGRRTFQSIKAPWRDAQGNIIGIVGISNDITERKRAQESARQAHQNFVEAVESLQDGFLALDRDWRFTYVNRRAATNVGFEPEGLIGRNMWELFPALVGTEQESAHRRAMSERMPVSLEVKGTLANKWYRLGISPTANGLAVVWTDITERKQAEEALRGSEERYRRLFENLNSAALLVEPILDAGGRVVDLKYLMANSAVSRHLKQGPNDLVGRWHSEVFPHPGRNPVFDIYERVLSTGESYKGEILLPALNRYYDIAVYRPTPGRLALVLSDITERKRADENLRQLNAELEQRVADRTAELGAASRYARSLIEASLDPLVTISAEGKITDVNDASIQATGVPREQLIGTDFSNYCTEPDKAREGYRRVFAEGFVRDYPLAIRHVSGRVTDVIYNATVYRNEAGEVQGIFAAARDVTERTRAEEAVNAERRRFRDALDQLPAYLVLLSPDYRVPFANRFFEERFGQSHGKRCYEYLFQRTEPCEHCETFEVLKTGHPHHWEWTGPDGRNYDVHDFPFTDTDGSPLIMEVGVDITETKQAQTALCQLNADLEQRVADRTAALQGSEERLREADRRKNEFIAILSHELRNPLAPIRFALPLLGEEQLGDAGRRATAVIDRQVTHLARLVDDLLDLSRITTGKIELRTDHVTLDAVLSAAVEAASPAIAAAQHSLDVAVPDAPIWLHADPARIAQVVTNLLNNSARYTPRGGRIRLEATASEAQVIIRVVDNGVGIVPDALPTVFEMFRQASGPHRAQGGLGIGLTLAKQLVEMHGGTIEARSAGENKGAEFIIRLPLAPAAGRPDETRAPKPFGRAGCLRVLVVDDNVDLVEMLALMVEASGHQVRKAFDGVSAVSAALEYQPHVVLLDIGMAGMDGIEVAKELRRHPVMASTRIVALTGWGQAEDRQRTAEAGFDDHVTKPADAERLRQVLERFAAEAFR